MEVEFISYVLKTDVAAVKFIGNCILTGIGGALNIFNTSGKLLIKEEIFKGQKIHGFCQGPGRNIAIWGGSRVALCTLQCDGDNVQISKPITRLHSDWILCLHWVKDESIALVTAHNELSLWDSKSLKRLKCITCTEKCILYNALIVGSLWTDLVVMAGTAFQEVIIWTVAGNNEKASESPVLHRLQGHNGVIFSISYNAVSRCLVSTSDDRSVRVWSVSGEWHNATVLLRHTLFGHKARVWRCVAVEDMVISIGEDSQLCVWGPEGQLLRRWSTHQGGKVWSVDCSVQHGLIVTGGGDGGVNLWPLRSWAEVSLTPVPLPFPTNLFPRKVCLAKNLTKIAITDSGCIVFQPLGLSEWNVADQDDRLSSYSILEVSPCKQFVAVGTLRGSVLIYQVKHDTIRCNIFKIIDENIIMEKVFSLQWLTSKLIMTCCSEGKLNLWRFKTSDKLEEVARCSLPKTKERWVSAALFLNPNETGELNTVNGVVICGDRGGNIHVYNLVDCETPLEPSQSYSRIHGPLGVCSLTMHGRKLFSTGRDGTVRQYEILGGALNLLSTDNVPMDWVTNTVDSKNGMLVLGFSEVHFVVWSWKERRNLLEIDCGGGHRSWDFSLDEENALHFVYVKDKMVHSIECPLEKLVKPILEDGFHSKEVVSVCLLPGLGSGHPILVSGGEDTTMRISGIGQDNRLKTLSILRSHISSVRALTTFPLSDRSNFLLFSAGGRAQLKVWKIVMEESPSAAVLPTVKCQQMKSHMLKQQDRRPWRVAEASPTTDAETRYMDLCAFCFPTETNRVMVLAGCSDGVLRLFSYNISNHELQLEIEYPEHHKRCILRVCHLPLQSSLQAMLSMATDGRIAFWAIADNTPDEIRRGEESGLRHLRPFEYLKIHQSGINSFDWLELEPGSFLLATGGDDNSLALTVLQINLNHLCQKVIVVKQKKIESMHSAQVTGLKFTGRHLISACIDQRVRLWIWSYTSVTDTLECSIVGEYCSTVADIQGLHVWQARNVMLACIYGKGMEVIATESRKTSINKT